MFGEFVSSIGDWLYLVALLIVIYQRAGNPVVLGLVGAARVLPYILLSIPAGIAADRYDRRMILLVTDLARGVIMVLMALVVVLNGPVEAIVALAILATCFSSFFSPAIGSYIPSLVRDESELGPANSTWSTLDNMAFIIGPAIAGLLIGFTGLAACFLLNAASYIAVIIGLIAMRQEELRVMPPSGLQRNVRSVIDQLTEGLRYVRDEPTVRLAMTVLGIVSTVALNFSVLLPLLASDVLHGDAGTYGFLMAATGVGSFGSAIMIAFGQRPTPRLLLAGAAAIGAGSVALAFSRFLPISMLLMLVVGWGVIAMAATTNTLIQLTTPDALRGRVMGVYTTVFAGSTPVGGLFAGAMAAEAGAPVALAAGGALALLTVGYAFWRLPGGRSRAFSYERVAQPRRP